MLIGGVHVRAIVWLTEEQFRLLKAQTLFHDWELMRDTAVRARHASREPFFDQVEAIMDDIALCREGPPELTMLDHVKALTKTP